MHPNVTQLSNHSLSLQGKSLPLPSVAEVIIQMYKSVQVTSLLLSSEWLSFPDRKWLSMGMLVICWGKKAIYVLATAYLSRVDFWQSLNHKLITVVLPWPCLTHWCRGWGEGSCLCLIHLCFPSIQTASPEAGLGRLASCTQEQHYMAAHWSASLTKLGVFWSQELYFTTMQLSTWRVAFS